ncbi:MAG: von Willebrand factor, type A [Methanoculleus marisnigri]|uniref:von Willebrand factor, type A n=1 Tax=Methanoculleus marisnigri TaxID=2198 RepID=A0A101GS73_9EURY|nr:MAG: von Willebrand factor, type A [Methanoculleus marisnigri]
MTLDFSTIRVNDEDREGETVFTYVHEDGISTTIESWVDNETGHHEIIPLETVDQTDDWNDDHTLQFNIGTVHLGQTWEATFRLKVLTDGNINVFGPNSAVTFNDGTDTLPLPDTFITAVPDLTNTGLGSATLGVSNPRYTCAEPVLELLTVAWDLAYTGSGTVTESVEYSNDGGLSWVRFDTPTANSGVTSEASSLDVGDLPPGEYLVRIRASADDAPDAGALFPPIRVGEHHTVYIRLA